MAKGDNRTSLSRLMAAVSIRLPIWALPPVEPDGLRFNAIWKLLFNCRPNDLTID